MGGCPRLSDSGGSAHAHAAVAQGFDFDTGGAQARSRDKWNFVPPGGESYDMVRGRVAGWLESLPGDVCLVAHGGVARVLMVILAGVTPRNAVGADIWQGKLLRIAPGRHDWLPGPGHWEP